jgi:hypothetical protein
VYNAVLQPHDRLMGLDLPSGGQYALKQSFDVHCIIQEFYFIIIIFLFVSISPLLSLFWLTLS